jgi:hypothetical protein
MLIQYSVDLPCEPRRRLGATTLANRLRHLTELVSSPCQAPGDIEYARRAEFQLRPYAFHCSRCPANFAGRAFGCHGLLQCPLSADGEEFLASLLPDTLGMRETRSGRSLHPLRGESTARLAALLRERNITGREWDCRRTKPGLARRRKPLIRRYGPLLRVMSISTSQLLEFMLLQEQLGHRDAELLCRALGVWEDRPPDGDGLPVVAFTQPLDPDDEVSVAELKDFLLALMLASSLEVPVRVALCSRETDAAGPQPRHPTGAPGSAGTHAVGDP